MAAVTIRRLGPGDSALVLTHPQLFDEPPDSACTAAFLADERALLLFAMVGECAVGFLSALAIGHPDNVAALFINELGIDEAWRRQGIATALVDAARAYARTAGLQGVWVAAEGDDTQAQAFYTSLKGTRARDAIVYEWAP